MSDKIYVATRKGLFTVERSSAGKWAIAGSAFIGDPVTMPAAKPPQIAAAEPPRKQYQWVTGAAADHRKAAAEGRRKAAAEPPHLVKMGCRVHHQHRLVFGFRRRVHPSWRCAFGNRPPARP